MVPGAHPKQKRQSEKRLLGVDHWRDTPQLFKIGVD
jgi:hypothetical protein